GAASVVFGRPHCTTTSFEPTLTVRQLKSRSARDSTLSSSSRAVSHTSSVAPSPSPPVSPAGVSLEVSSSSPQAATNRESAASPARSFIGRRCLVMEELLLGLGSVGRDEANEGILDVRGRAGAGLVR